ncbi:MAG: acetate/propionate family kinase, partial [Planctomycetes bacterium]|nr:acetate/propionate family kinase [Planctomycetota bacterium]
DLKSAAELGLRDRETISIRIPGPRGLVFENVLVRVNKDFALAFHVDTDEGNAAGIEPGVEGTIA